MKKILVIGPNPFSKKVRGGPSSVFEGIMKYSNSSNILSYFPKIKENKIKQYFKLIFIVLRKWDVINVHLGGYHGLIVGLLRFRSDKIFITIHGFNPIQTNNINKILAITQIIQIKYLFKNRIYVSKLIKKKVEQYLNIKGGYVLYSGINYAKIDHIKKKYEYSNKNYDIFSLCGYSETKGIEYLLSVLEKFEKPITCLIAGPYKNNSKYKFISEKKINKCKIIFKGQLTYNEVIHLMLKSKIYVNPAKYESFGVTTLEAMYLGLPCVVSSGAGICEVLENNINSIVVDYNQIEEMKYYIEQLLEDKTLYNRLLVREKELALKFDYKRKTKEMIYFLATVNN